MKKLFALFAIVALLSACDGQSPQQQVQYQQPAPVVVQQPAPTVVVQQADSHSDAGALLAGAAIGAVAATALSNNDRDRYYQSPTIQSQPQQVTKIVNKTVVVNNNVIAAPAQAQPAAPKTTSFAIPGTSNPVPVVKSMPAPITQVAQVKPAVPALTYAPKALPAPAAPVNLSKPAQVSYAPKQTTSYAAPKASYGSSSSYSSSPMKVTYRGK